MPPPRSPRHSRIRALGLPAAPLYALACGLSYSRLYLGVHYPSDVLAGALLGTAVASVRSRPAHAPIVSQTAARHPGAQSNGHAPQAFAAPREWGVP